MSKAKDLGMPLKCPVQVLDARRGEGGHRAGHMVPEGVELARLWAGPMP